MNDNLDAKWLTELDAAKATALAAADKTPKVPNPEEVQERIDQAYNLGWEAGARAGGTAGNYTWPLIAVGVLYAVLGAMAWAKWG